MQEQRDMQDEERRMRRLRRTVDLALAILMQSEMTYPEALQLVADTKEAALTLFPEKAQVFDLIYSPRFMRIINERFLSFSSSSFSRN